MNLFRTITGRHQFGNLFVSSKRRLHVDQLSELEGHYGALLCSLSGRRIALQLRSQPQLAEAILLLDGVCEQVILLPQDLTHETVAHFMLSTGSELLVSDNPSGKVGTYTISFEPIAGNPPARDYATDWLLSTSGTTGVPKLIRHSMNSLSRTVKRDEKKGKTITWGLLYEINRFAGLQVYLQALLGVSALIIPEYADAPLAQQLELFGEQRVNALSATPSMWRKMIMSGELDRLHLSLITLGGEIATQSTIDALAGQFPDARITHVYASTEFGVGFAVADRYEGFPAAWLRNRDFPFKLDEETGELYYIQGGGEPVGTGDGAIIEGDRVRFRGRLNGSINVGGNKVMPEEIERVLLQHPAVALASVSGRKNPIIGQLVQADVVLNAAYLPSPDTKTSIIHLCRKHLEIFKVPAIIEFVDTLDLSANGKIVRR